MATEEAAVDVAVPGFHSLGWPEREPLQARPDQQMGVRLQAGQQRSDRVTWGQIRPGQVSGET